ncbi:hypothetical protein GCM10009613_13850 [Pseudonocardia kongjuensis]|uniref:Uncharacterized protein n=1 Tax=Pseudonocardia kongjuensis TaxID=102227 RepID=A0ABN1XRD0_9PSEU
MERLRRGLSARWLSTAGLPVEGAALALYVAARPASGRPVTASLPGRAGSPQGVAGEWLPATPPE